MKTHSFRKYLNKSLKNPEFKKEYEKLKDEFEPTMYAIVDDNGKIVSDCSVYKKFAIESVIYDTIKMPTVTWKQLYKKGYRIIKVKIKRI